MLINQKKHKKNIDIPSFDISFHPGNNFYMFVNNNWLRKTHIPKYVSSYSINEEIEDLIDDDLFNILKECEFLTEENSKKEIYTPSFEDTIGRFILSSMRIKVQKNSIYLLKQKIQNLHCIRSIDDIGEVIGYLCKHKIPTVLDTYLQLERTKENKSIYTLVIAEGFFGLPDASYYTASAPGKLRTLYAYINFVKNICNLLKIDDLSSVIPLESSFAIEIKKVENVKDEALFTGAQLLKKFPHFPWNSFFVSLGVTEYLNNTFRINSTNYISFLEKIFETSSFENWKQLFILHTIFHALPLLPPPFDNVHFEFFQKRLRGQKEKISQKYLTLNLIKSYLSSPLSILYKKQYLKNRIKENAIRFIKSIQSSAVSQLSKNSWMEKKTKEEAIKKIDHMVLSVGWPEKYPPIYLPILQTDNLLYNIYVLSSAKTKEEIELLNKTSKPGTYWNEPTYLVNAFYYNEINEFIIPAGILNFPFYNEKNSVGWNYGGLGAVIGHEMVHAFDDDGKNYDKYGLLKRWWGKKDLRYFKKLSTKLIEQFNLSKLFGIKINGKKTFSENLADLGGLSIALEALKKEISSLSEEKKKKELQSFFISYAVSWRTKEEKQKTLQSLIVDVHAPPEIRVNNIVVHFDEWYSVFDIQIGDKMYIPPEERINVFN